MHASPLTAAAPPSVPPQAKWERVERAHASAREGGGAERVARQHARGKLTARERLDVLLDPGSFLEAGALVQHREFRLV
jgi:propionyl-CoA carboxylase beta chain